MTPDKAHFALPTVDELDYEQHAPMPVVKAAMASFDRPTRDLSEEQRDVIAHLHQWLDTVRSRIESGDVTVYSSDTLLLEPLCYISTWFFMNRLHPIHGVFWEHDFHVTHRELQNLPGGSDLLRHENPPIVFTRLNPNNRVHPTAEEILASILHEACHAFLMYYACKLGCQLCQRRPSYHHIVEIHGKEAHGIAWQTLAYHVEKRVIEEGFALEKGLDRAVSSVYEYQKFGVYPNRHVVRKFFGGICPVTRLEQSRFEKLRLTLKEWFGELKEWFRK